MKYFLKGSWEKEYTEVTKEQYIEAEEGAGFFPKPGCGDVATDSFSGHGIRGKVNYEDENGDKAEDVLTTYNDEKEKA